MLLPLLLTALLAPLTAQQPAASATLQLPRGTVHLDQPGDGRIWAKGDDWKASFGADGVAFVPFLGAAAPRNFPLALQLVRVTSGVRDVPFAAVGRPLPRGEARIEIARGSVVEAYDLRAGGIEQMFVFVDAPRNGALAVELAITSELHGEALADGACRFRNEHGGVDIGKATVIDAAGRTAPCTLSFTPERLRWTVPAEFVAAATFPLTIDPLITTSGLLPAQVTPLLLPDVAFVGSWGGWYGAVIEEIFSATDHDVVIVARDSAGNLGDTEYVDFTSVSWIRPKVASHRTASQFLCVAQRAGSSAFGIAARLVDFSALGGFPTLSALGQIPVTTTIFEARPDVGGDGSILSALPGDYCITWEANGAVFYRRIDTTGAFGIVQTIPSTQPATNARIAKSCGSNLAAVADWTIVYEQEVNASDHDIWGMRLSRTGQAGVPFAIATGPTDDRHAEVSAKADLIAGEPWMVVWDRFVPGGPFTFAHFDIHGAVYSQDSAITPATNLTSLLLRTTSFDQTNPCVDSDGIRFAVGFAERPQAVADVQPYLATVHVANGSSLDVTAYAELLNASASPDDHLQITSEHSGGASTSGYMAVWDVTLSSNVVTSVGALYQGHVNISSASYFAHILNGCGQMQITEAGLPALGQVISITLVGAQGIPILALGTSVPPIPLCVACELGVDPATAVLLLTTNYSLQIPADTALIATQVAAQGIDFLAPGGCASPILATLTDELLITLL
ncbi:MAG: hypothetical protein MUC36_12640 [Planctomycetes bacterium]|nr:hypothetical protein [Planctomycetota bacterium]